MSQCEEGHCLIAEAKGADHRCDHKCAYADRDTCNHGECFGGKCIYEGATMTKQSDTPRTDENENKQFCRECGGRIDAEFARQLERELTALRAENEGLREKLEAAQDELDGYRRSDASHKRNVREIDVVLNGEDGAAEQASICDILSQLAIEWPELKTAECERDAALIANNDLQDHFDAMAIERKAALAAMAGFRERAANVCDDLAEKQAATNAAHPNHAQAYPSWTQRIAHFRMCAAAIRALPAPSLEEGERIVRDAERLPSVEMDLGIATMKLRGADRLAYAVAKLTCRNALDQRSEAADALLDYLGIGGHGGPADVPTWMKQYIDAQRGE